MLKRLAICDGSQHKDLRVQNPSNHAAHQEASSKLVAFRNSQAPVAVCQHILDHSNSEQANFQVHLTPNYKCLQFFTVFSLRPDVLQAVVTLRDAAVREWATTPKQGQRAMRGYVLHHILRHAHRFNVVCHCAF